MTTAVVIGVLIVLALFAVLVVGLLRAAALRVPRPLPRSDEADGSSD
jgi:hypothetical protein